MGWRNNGLTACDPYYDRPFCGEVIFYNSYDNSYDIRVKNRGFPVYVNGDFVTLFIQEIYDETVKLQNESVKHYESYIKCKSDMRKLLSSVEGEF